MERNPYTPPEAELESPSLQGAAAGGPEGLGGWLILVGIAIVLTPLMMLFGLSQTFPPLFNDGVWQALTTPGSEQYRPGFAALVVFEIAMNVAIIVVTIFSIALFFRKSMRVPRWYIGILLAGLASLIFDLIGVRMVLPDIPMDVGTMRDLVRSAIACAIWIPYMLVSVRVKNTFVQAN